MAAERSCKEEENMNKVKREPSLPRHAPVDSPSRPPCVLMTASAAMQADCAALRKLVESGVEAVVVQDADFENSLRIIEQVRRSTPGSVCETANIYERSSHPSERKKT